MKNNFLLLALCLASFSIGFIHSCKKDVGSPILADTPPDSIITTSFREEFINVPTLTTTAGWVTKNNSVDSNDYVLTDWGQGIWGVDKSGQEFGFPAYSDSASKDEYAFSGATAAPISSWLITPVLSVENTDKIFFYTRTYSDNTYSGDRMQVLMNKSTSTDVGGTLSAGSFTTVLIDINPTQSLGGYPAAWTKYEYTFSGISGKINTRIAFRHYVDGSANAQGVAIDAFEFEVN
jgi:hypothetical protein